MTDNQELVEGLHRAAKPLMEYLKQCHLPHTLVTVDSEHAELTECTRRCSVRLDGGFQVSPVKNDEYIADLMAAAFSEDKYLAAAVILSGLSSIDFYKLDPDKRQNWRDTAKRQLFRLNGGYISVVQHVKS